MSQEEVLKVLADGKARSASEISAEIGVRDQVRPLRVLTKTGEIEVKTISRRRYYSLAKVRT